MPQSGPPGVLCSGAIVLDILVHPGNDSPWGTTTFVETIKYNIGGNGANTSLALARVGVPVRLLGSVGADDQGRLVLATLENAGVDISFVVRSAEPTPTTIVFVNAAGDRKFFHRLGASAGSFSEVPDFTPQFIGGAIHYHLASLFILPALRPHAAEFLIRARAAGLKTSLDTNWDPQGRWMEDIASCLPHLDYLFMNEDEARMVTGSSDPAAAAAVVRSHGVKIAVMKLGRLGCAIFSDSGELRCPAFDVEPKDTTGAGDCFVAGFLAAQLRGASLEEAGRYANALGAITVQQIGAVSGFSSHEEVLAWIHAACPRPATP